MWTYLSLPESLFEYGPSMLLINDQQYYAYVPKDAEVGSLYEVKLTEVEKIEEV